MPLPGKLSFNMKLSFGVGQAAKGPFGADRGARSYAKDSATFRDPVALDDVRVDLVLSPLPADPGTAR